MKYFHVSQDKKTLYPRSKMTFKLSLCILYGRREKDRLVCTRIHHVYTIHGTSLWANRDKQDVCGFLCGFSSLQENFFD